MFKIQNNQELIDLITIRDFLRWAVSCFQAAKLYYGHGTDNAWDDAVALVLHTLHLPADINPNVLDAKLLLSERAALIEKISRRTNDRIPVAYLTQEAWFGGMPFYVDHNVLIPRSPLAELIENQFQPWLEPEKINTILDLCTGSGCIAIACAQAFPEAEIDASDISTAALAVAKINVSKHELTHQVHLHQADLFNHLPAKKYDLIVSNPPYVSAAEMQSLPAEYLHEPALALAAGEDGLDQAIKIMQQAPAYLSADGILIVEVGNSEEALAERFPEIPFTWLEFQNGGGGVFLLTATQLQEAQSVLA
jgi:ribosomal protein L3 glutamine methyltransferase